MSATYHMVLHRPSQRHEGVLHRTPEWLINYSRWEQCERVEMGPQDWRTEMLCFPFFLLLCLFSPSTLNEVGHSGLYLSKSHCKLPGILFSFISHSPPPPPPPPLDELSNRFQFPEIPFLVKLFIFLQSIAPCLKSLQFLNISSSLLHSTEDVSFKFSLYKNIWKE